MLFFPRLLARSLPSLFLCGVMLATHAHAEPFHFAVLMHVLQETGDETELKIALESAQAANPTFIVVNGMRSKREPCTDRLYRQRTALLESSVAPVV